MKSKCVRTVATWLKFQSFDMGECSGVLRNLGDDDVFNRRLEHEFHACGWHGVLNLWQGFVPILQFIFAILVDALLSYCPTLVISSICYTIGLGMLSLSTPAMTGSCKEYKAECIGLPQKILFYIALANIAVGISGQTVALVPFFQYQHERWLSRYRSEETAYECAVGSSILIGILTGIFLPLIGKERWSISFGLPAILYLLATILFLFVVRLDLYYPMTPEGSPFIKVVRVIAASVYKIFLKHPDDPTRLYEDSNKNHKIPHTPGLRFLDKAAISSGPDAYSWSICTVTEVEETKTTIRIIPLAMTFIICGLVSAIGNTYFVEQANHMNRKVGKLKVPLFFLLIIHEISKLIFNGLHSLFTYCMDKAGKKKYAPQIGMSLAMVFSILCCVIAAKVEIRRLNVIRIHGLLDKPKDTIPMSMFWLVPQFFLLAGLSSFLEQSVTVFFKDQIPPSLIKYDIYFANGVLGLGTMASVFSVHLSGKVSENGGKTGWFQDTLNKSRLDKYYWVLAALSAANLLLYVFVASFYPYKEAAEDEDYDEEDDPQNRIVLPLGMPVI
ncbi:hypothetical protein ACJIZ3_022110 [Penstemon smallii]|uniref:Uncharacterized protein n=1 Tax=Penstemon smallii TaxID=265156 RepID=A0ABD3SNZ3_9LAMI